MRVKTAIIGYGHVGVAQGRLFPGSVTYDLAWGNRRDVNKCDVAFVCVPTPNLPDGSLDTSAVKEAVEWCECPLTVIRSTVPPGTCDWLAWRHPNKYIVYQPEYLGETIQHPLANVHERSFLVIGGRPADRRKLIELYQGVYNANITILQLSFREAEVAKLAENRAIAFKVAQCQELYDACEAAGVDYYTIREVVYGTDPRFDLWFSFVYPDKRGMNSKCIPKDVLAWAAWAESTGASASVTREILRRNEEWLALNPTPEGG